MKGLLFPFPQPGQRKIAGFPCLAFFMEISPLPQLEEIAQHSIGVGSSLFRAFQPFLKIIVGVFIGYFLLVILIEFLKKESEERLASRKIKHQEITEKIIYLKIVEPIIEARIKRFIERKREELKEYLLIPEEGVKEFKEKTKKDIERLFEELKKLKKF